MRLNFKVAVRGGIFLGALWLISYLIVSHPNFINDIRNFSLSSLFAIVVFYILFYYLNGLILKVLVANDERNCNVITMVGISQVSSLAGYITPFRSGGVGLRSVLLKKYFEVDYSESIANFMLVFLITITSNVFVGLVLVLLSDPKYILNEYIMAIFLFLFLCVGGFFLFPFKRFILNLKCGFLPEFFTKMLFFLTGYGVKRIGFIFFLCLAQLFTQSIITWFLIEGVGEVPDLTVCIGLSVLSNLALAISLTPGNVGVKEFVLLFFGERFLLDSTSFLSALLIDRGIQIFMLVGGSLFFFYFRKYYKLPL